METTDLPGRRQWQRRNSPEYDDRPGNSGGSFGGEGPARQPINLRGWRTAAVDSCAPEAGTPGSETGKFRGSFPFRPAVAARA